MTFSNSDDTIRYHARSHNNRSEWKHFRFRVERLLQHSGNMDTSWLSSTSSGVFNYLYKHITGDDESVRPSSSLDVLSKANVWITDLPTNNYEPLEASHGARRSPKKVGVSFL